MFLIADSKSEASSANISCLCVFTSYMCVYMSSACVTAVCIGTVGGDEGLLCVFCVLRLVDVEKWWKMTDASWHVCETLVTVMHVCLCHLSLWSCIYTNVMSVFKCMEQLNRCSPAHRVICDDIPDNRHLFCVSLRSFSIWSYVYIKNRTFTEVKKTV